jgi:hypothetical protein
LAKVIRKFSVEDLEEEYELPWEALANWELDKHRWYTWRELIFLADDGKHYAVDYMDPATENQEGQDCWEDTRGYVEAVQVEPKEVTTIKWVPVVVSDQSVADKRI